MHRGVLPLCVGLVAVMVSCAHPAPTEGRDATPAPVEKATPLANAPTVAIQGVDAPGYNIEDLTARLRDGFISTSGVVVVDQLSVRAEIAACIEMPCPDVQQQRFKDASIVVNATMSKVGAAILGSLRITKGLKEIARINASGHDAGAVATDLGQQGGAALRKVLTTLVPGAETAGPPAAER